MSTDEYLSLRSFLPALRRPTLLSQRQSFILYFLACLSVNSMLSILVTIRNRVGRGFTKRTYECDRY